MKNAFVLFILILNMSVAYGQLSGSAFLEGQSNHSGIRVKFTAQSGTAITDSAFTNNSGNYNINITPGVYTVSFAKPGYVDVFKDNGASGVLTNTTSIPGVTLAPGNPAFIYGPVSGTWTPSNVYVVLSNVTIASGDVLTILPGTQVRFNGFYSITGEGVIKALGSPGNRILFTSGRQVKSRQDWDMIQLSSLSSVFDYCVFENATFAMNFQQGSANVTNCVIREGIGAGYFGAGHPVISNNEVYNLGTSSKGAMGFWLEGSASGTVSCNYLHDMQSTYFAVNHNFSLVRDNRIDNLGPLSVGIEARYAGSRSINNTISNTGTGIYLNGDWQTTNPLVVNNTLFSNENGILISCRTYRVNAVIVNNLITGNNYGISQTGNTTGNSTIDHNDVWSNSTANYSNVQVAGLGQAVATNSAGYSIDSYFNISENPMYNGLPPLLSSWSPCFTSENATYDNQIGFRAPVGCIEAISSLGIREMPASLRVYPNPCDGIFQLSGVPWQQVTINVFAMDGHNVYSSVMESGQQIDARHLENGVYLVKVSLADQIRTSLLTVLK
jgi:hypothetical protein